ncbi:MAG: hypothetical protein ACYTGL_23095 [Planctomycetota bacterium]|jgi:hypothetical protein
MTTSVTPGSPQPRSKEQLRSLVQQSIGGTFFRQMMKALRSTTGNAAYFNGGQAEKIFQGQLDEIIIEKLAESSGDIFTEGMFEQQFSNLSAETNDSRSTTSSPEPSANADNSQTPPRASSGFDARV